MQEHRPNTVRILAVDDEQHVRELYEEFLSYPTSNYKFDLTLCRQSKEAVEAVRAATEAGTPFSLAFIDIRMDSGKDGVWAAGEIRKLDPKIEIVMVTAFGDVDPEEIVSTAPPAAKLLYLKKPFSPEEIRQFALALSAKWQQERELHKMQVELENHVAERTVDLTNTNEQLKREIEERILAEAEIRKSEKRYRAVVEDMPAMICRFLPDGTLTFVNGTYCSYFGKQREDLLGENFFQFIPEEDQEKVKEHFLSLAADRPMVTYDHQVIAPNEAIRWQRWTDRALFDEQGALVEYQSVGYDVTENKQAEEALRESEEKYRTIIENIEDGYFEVDLAGNFTSFNDSLCRIAGYPREELMGMNNRDYTSAETAKSMYQIFNETYSTGEPAKMVDYEIFRKDGSPRILEMSASLMKDSTGEPVGFRGVVRDVTERKRAEEALRESEERFREMAENLREVFWMFDWVKQKVIYVSPAYKEIWGRSIQNLYKSYEEWSKSIHPDDTEYARESFAKIVETGGGEPREYRIVRPDGTVRWISDRGFAIQGEDGQVQRIAGIAEDITERYQAMEALRASEEKYRTALEANPDPVVVYDIEGKVVYFNPAFTRVFGWSLGERLGKKMDLFVPEESWPETKMMIDRVLAGESFSGIESSRYNKKSKIIPVSISGAVLRDMDGNPVGSVINLRDISEQKNLESQLQHAQKMEAVGTLAGGIAHDFNNLLQAIQGYTELLLMRKKDGEPGFRELQEVIRASKRGAELTKQLLTFSRKVESKRKPLDLNQEVGELRQLLERALPKMIEVEFNLDPDLQMIKADSTQLKQVLMNLALNAKDAMPGGGKLVIETQNITLDEEFCKRYAEIKPGEYVLLSMADTGHGMDKETLEHIFDPFYTTKEVGKGTGLGLAIVYGIVKNHEGYVMCYSRPESGTSFRVYLPVSEAVPECAEVVEALEAKPLAMGGDETILLVDDEEFIRELGVDVLGQAGYKVLTARNGEQALEVYRREQDQVDLIILDLIMPGMGGSKCLEELLKIGSQARVLIASGYSPDASTKGALETGAAGFINKPYDTKQLLKLVRKILDKS